ncbi:MAG: hypothetical protein HXY50_08295 [Ignavibacteriaceae bacterium]|nr:hypothetical protein [Ignavibacteriaceae bacterium]
MTPERYVKTFRLVAAISWLGLGLTAIVLMIFAVIPRHEIIPLGALLLGSIPILIFKLFNKVECPRCKHKMKISSSFPNIVYKCSRCSHIINTGIYGG